MLKFYDYFKQQFYVITTARFIHIDLFHFKRARNRRNVILVTYDAFLAVTFEIGFSKPL